MYYAFRYSSSAKEGQRTIALPLGLTSPLIPQKEWNLLCVSKGGGKLSCYVASHLGRLSLLPSVK